MDGFVVPPVSRVSTSYSYELGTWQGGTPERQVLAAANASRTYVFEVRQTRDPFNTPLPSRRSSRSRSRRRKAKALFRLSLGVSNRMCSCVDDMTDPQAKRQRDSCGSQVLRRLASRRQLTRVVPVLVVALGLYQCLIGPYIGRFKYRQQLAPPAMEVVEAATAALDSTGVHALLTVLRRRDTRRHLIIHVQFGLGNRLRALASGMAVAAARHMPMLVVWSRDAHCNCSFSQLFDASTARRFALLDAPAGPWEAELWAAVRADADSFEAHSYMREDGCGPSAADRAWLAREDAAQHLFVKSAYLLNHGRGDWMFARWQLHSLQPRPELAAQLVATYAMVGLHVRSVVDTGAAYGTTPAAIQREWRSKGDWPQARLPAPSLQAARLRQLPPASRAPPARPRVLPRGRAPLPHAHPPAQLRTSARCVVPRAVCRADAARASRHVLLPSGRRTGRIRRAARGIPWSDRHHASRVSFGPRCGLRGARRGLRAHGAGRHAQPGAHAEVAGLHLLANDGPNPNSLTLTLTLPLTLTPTRTLTFFLPRTRTRTRTRALIPALALTRILGSGYSSFSEAARFYGSTHNLLPGGAPAGYSGWEWFHSLPDFETAGVDFGEGDNSISNGTRVMARKG